MMMKIIILMIMRIDGEVQPWCRTNAILEIRSPAQITSGARPHLHHHYLRHFHRHQHQHYLRHCHRHQHHNRHFMFITFLGFIFMLSSPGSGKKRTPMGHNCRDMGLYVNCALPTMVWCSNCGWFYPLKGWWGITTYMASQGGASRINHRHCFIPS